MTEEAWKWYAAYDDEGPASGPYETREAALAAARDEGTRLIYQALPPAQLRLADYISVDNMIQYAEEYARESHGNPDYNDAIIFDLNDADHTSLLDAIQAAVNAWQDAKGRKFTSNVFEAVRAEEWLPVEEEFVTD